MPPLGQIWRSFSMPSKTALQWGLFFTAPHTACVITGVFWDCHSDISIVWQWVAQKTRYSQSCNSPKSVLTIFQPSQFCQPAGFALESTWSSNLSVFSSCQWLMTFSSINSTGLTAETLCQAAHHSTCKDLFLRRGPEKCSKGMCGQSAADKDCVYWDIHKFTVD